TGRGNVANLIASRDILMSTDISGTLGNVTVGRNLGDINDPSVLLVRGDLTGVSIENGGLYSDIRVANAVTGSIIIGARPGLPNNNLIPTGSIEAYGRINSIVVNGDYAGSIMSYSGGIGNVTINNGSLLPSGSVSAFNNDIGSLVINSGHLLGDVHADRTIFNITVNASEDGVFGDIGVNPELSGFVGATSLRNQLPPGVGITSGYDGPSITAGRDIGVVNVTGGSVFEAVFHAKNAIGEINVTGNVANDANTTGFGTQIVAGNSVGLVNVTGSAANMLVAAGLYDLASDGRAGGTGLAEDVTKAGRVRQVSIAGDATNVGVAAGMVAGADGVYNTADDLHTLGVSVIDNVTVGGTVTNVSANADTGLPSRSAGITTAGQATPVVGGRLFMLPFTQDQSNFDFTTLGEVIASGTTLNFTRGAANGTISFSGPGTAVWDAANGRLLLISTGINSSVTVTSDTGALEDFSILSNDDASIGSIDVQAVMFGNSNIVIDGYAREIVLGGFQGTGDILVGNDVQLLQTGSLLTSGTISATLMRQLVVNGDLGGATPQLPGEFVTPTLRLFGTEGITVQGSMRANLSVDNGIRGALAVTGSINNSVIRSGHDILSVTAFDISSSTIAAANDLGSVTTTGSVFASNILSGVDLGRDAAFGGEGVNADRTNGGNIGTVTVGGNFAQSSIAAGVLRGVDGFLGTSDDIVSGGRSTIGSVSIAGTQLGSSRGSESFGVFATGAIGSVTVNGAALTQQGNFRVERVATLPDVVQVDDIEVTYDGGIYTARVFFNQAMNAQTLRDGLIISEVRDGGTIKIRLDEGEDYLFSYDSAENAAVITFFDSVTRRDLPQLPGVAGPGLYRFELDPGVVRGQNSAARLDADADGFADEDRFFAGDAFVGDVGDKITPNTVIIDRGFSGPGTVDFYGPGNLDTALDDKFQPDALPDINREFTLRGFIGDHPDHDAQGFSLGSDADLYTITLQAGQILRLGPNTGSAFNANVQLLSPGQQSQLGITADTTTLPADTSQLLEGVVTFGNTYLITQTGTFYLLVSNLLDSGTAFDPDAVEDIQPNAGEVGSYSFTIEVFDDGDSGFSASTNSGNGRNLIEAPFANQFAGPDGQLGTADDRAAVTVGSYTFTRNNETGIITGTDGRGVVSTRLADGTSVTEVMSAIGAEGAAGIPGQIAPDVDIYHLNNRQNIRAGEELRITLKLSETGADLGGRQSTGSLEAIIQDFSGAVQFGLFNTSNSNGISDGQLVFSPSEFGTISGAGAEILAQDSLLTYGTDENGDFFIQAQVPETGTYAFYLQGVFNADYVVEIQRQSVAPSVQAFAGSDGVFGTFDDIQRVIEGRFRYTLNRGDDGTAGTADDSVEAQLITESQNVFIEFNGGSIDWLEVGGVSTDLLPYSSSGLGFSGTIDGLPVDTFVQREVVNNLNAIFQSAGYDITFSATPGAFQGEDFSTVYISDSNDPVNFTFAADSNNFFFNPFTFGIGDFGLSFEEIYGYSERSDPFNADKNDEAVVFVPQLTGLGFNPSEGDVRDLTDSLAAAVGRRVGELLGLRTTFQTGPSGAVDVFAANSPSVLPTGGGSYVVPSFSRPLSSRFDPLADTQFFLGQQNSQSLLDQILLRF
ncbi:MAG: beta strand repeat-containing protein, partial [Phycisphaerales bacterium JB064]